MVFWAEKEEKELYQDAFGWIMKCRWTIKGSTEILKAAAKGEPISVHDLSWIRAEILYSWIGSNAAQVIGTFLLSESF